MHVAATIFELQTKLPTLRKFAKHIWGCKFSRGHFDVGGGRQRDSKLGRIQVDVARSDQGHLKIEPEMRLVRLQMVRAEVTCKATLSKYVGYSVDGARITGLEMQKVMDDDNHKYSCLSPVAEFRLLVDFDQGVFR